MKKETNFTPFDTYCYEHLTLTTKNSQDRTIYKCFINKTVPCPVNYQAVSKAKAELNRLFLHFQKHHENDLISEAISWAKNNNITDFSKISSNELFCIYFQEKIFPKGSSLLNQNPNDIGKDSNGQFIDLSLVPLDKLNQIILENGIFEHIPLYVIESEHHSKFIGQYMMLAYEIAKNTSISREDFLQIVNNLRVPHNLLNKVGKDYYNSSTSYFRGCEATFQIDAGTINSNRQLVFVLSCLQRGYRNMLYHVEKDFDGSLNSYRNTVRKVILKAKDSNISIVALVTDNLPVQIKALSHQSLYSIQNIFSDMTSIIHLRCTNHLLALAFWDWMKTSNELTKYEKKLKNVMNVFNKQGFLYHINHKIPSICQT